MIKPNQESSFKPQVFNYTPSFEDSERAVILLEELGKFFANAQGSSREVYDAYVSNSIKADSVTFKEVENEEVSGLH